MNEPSIEELLRAKYPEAEVREHWPEATWMPWDKTPVGQRVLVNPDEPPTNQFRSGIVVGRVERRDDPAAQPHCSTCTCPAPPNPTLGWWIVRLELPEGYMVSGVVRTSMDTLQYPPSLRPCNE